LLHPHNIARTYTFTGSQHIWHQIKPAPDEKHKLTSKEQHQLRVSQPRYKPGPNETHK